MRRAIGAGYRGSGSDNCGLRTWDATKVAGFRGRPTTPPPGFLQKSPQVIENKQREEPRKGKEIPRACKLLMPGYLPDPSEKTVLRDVEPGRWTNTTYLNRHGEPAKLVRGTESGQKTIRLSFRVLCFSLERFHAAVCNVDVFCPYGFDWRA
jgi:hypothetical protein